MTELLAFSLDVARVFLIITLTGCLFTIGIVALVRWHLASEERRYQKELRRARIPAELRAAERRREDELQVIGRLPREATVDSKTRRLA